MDIAAAGALILFFSVLVALILVALLVFAYAAYSFLAVLSNTAVGYDEILWPGEPISDWYFKGWYLGWLVAVWAVPATFLVSLFNPPGPLFAVCVAACLWLLFPIGLLSSLSAESRLLVLRPMIIRLLLRHLGATLRFYASSGLVVLVSGTLGYAAVFGLRFLYPSMHKSTGELRLRLATALDQPLILVPLAAVVCAAGWLIYARLLGRTAWITGQSSSEEESDPEENSGEDEEPRPRPREQQSKEPPQKNKPRAKKPKRAHDPWAIPAKEPMRKTKPTRSPASLPEDPYGPAEGTYELMANEAAPQPTAPPKSGALEEEEVEPYAISPPSEAPPSKLPPAELPKVSKFEEELAAPRIRPPLPDLPFVTGVYSFPFYPHTLGPWGTVALGLCVVLALLRLLFYLLPF